MVGNQMLFDEEKVLLKELKQKILHLGDSL